MKNTNALLFIFLVLSAVPARADITSNLEGWWKFDDGAGSKTALDSSGNGNAGTLSPAPPSSSAPSWTTGESGGALSFNGTTNYVSVVSSSSLNSVATSNQITISAWIKVSSLNNTYQEIARKNNWFLLINSNNQISLSSSGAYGEYTTGFSFTADNQWHLITGTFDGTTIRLYEDGTLQTSYAGAALTSSTTPLYIGGYSGQCFSGSIDDVRVYSRALAQSDITELFGKTPISLTTDNISYTATPAIVLLTAMTYPASGVTIQNVEFYSNNNGTVTDLGAGQAGTTANTYTFTWNNVPTATYSMSAVVTDSTGAKTTSLPVNIYVNTQVLNYTVNSYGLQSLQYNGQQFIISPPGQSTYEMDSVLFQAPDGTQKPYGWVTGSLGGPPAVGNSTKSYYTGSACSQILPSNWSTVSPGSDPVCNQNIYTGNGAGGTDGYTVTTLYTASDPKTLKIDYYVTNNDSTDTLEQFSDEYFMELVTPNIVDAPGWLAVGTGGNASPVAFIPGTWGSMALYTDDYTKKAQFTDVWTISSPSTTAVNYLWNFTNCSTPGGSSSNSKCDVILPAQTYHYALYISFGTPTDTAATLAANAYTSFGTSYPYLVNWPDRRPIARWFIGNGVPSATNPRSYLWNTSLDVSNQTNFNTQLLAMTNSIVTRMNSMNPRPQGIVLWDLEGDEFDQYFTYVGYPNKLHDLAPEMDAVADQMFAAFKAAGYQVGMTLRPGDFQTGPTSALPSTCTSSSSNVDLDDIYIATDGTYPNRGYTCTATNTWSNVNARWPYHQHSPQDDATLLSNLESKVTYARNRWGARLFYVDSTVYSGNGGGGSFNFNIFRQLQQVFPDCIFFPENENDNFYGASAPYNQANSAVGGYIYDSSSTAKLIYPQAFSIIAQVDAAPISVQPTLVQSLKNGNIFFYENIWWEQDTLVEQLYQDADIPSNSLIGYGLTVTSSGLGNVTSDLGAINCPSANCTAAFDGGTSVTLTAVPASGSVFTGWSGGSCSGTATTCVVHMNSNQTVTANFTISSSTLLGDVTGEGQVTIYDAELTARYAIGMQVANFNTTAAEVDGTSKVDIYDAYLIAEYAVGLINKFPVQH